MKKRKILAYFGRESKRVILDLSRNRVGRSHIVAMSVKFTVINQEHPTINTFLKTLMQTKVIVVKPSD